jgi:hypothetical protein
LYLAKISWFWFLLQRTTPPCLTKIDFFMGHFSEN